jgi:2-polyprenyl-3-methyl-5-hydroxy-6-metoxy-1,4-benzoquinol methylase
MTPKASAATPFSLSRDAFELYRGGPLLRRALVTGRPLICPFDRLLTLVPVGASVLDVGCGDGLFLALLASSGRLGAGAGVDYNTAAIANARYATANLPAGALSFEARSPEAPWPPERYDVVSLIDVLHHVPTPARQALVHQALSHVRPGGMLLYKDIALRPAWRRHCNTAHDWLLTRELVNYTPFDSVRQWVHERGGTLDVHEHINRLWYGHELACFTSG